MHKCCICCKCNTVYPNIPNVREEVRVRVRVRVIQYKKHTVDKKVFGTTTKLENFWCFRQQCIWILAVFDNNVYGFYKDFSSLLQQSSLGFYKSSHLESNKDLVRI